ncbi:MAG: ISNCY family transposase, partial [Okeania sp. SIO3B3]|nr:ISNCY family transposase [Okeania sp. SIO3B3]
MDGLQYFSSKQIHCKKCNQKRDTETGEVTYSHSAITPAFVSPEYTIALAMAPEFIHLQDGNTKQDCERNAAKRWLTRKGKGLSELGIAVSGDDLYANQPFCEQILENENEVKTFTRTVRIKNKKHLYSYRYTENVPMRDSEDALKVSWLEVVVHDTDGKQLYKNTFITNHILDSDETVVELASAGRARWTIENENNNTLKTKGYHL